MGVSVNDAGSSSTIHPIQPLSNGPAVIQRYLDLAALDDFLCVSQKICPMQILEVCKIPYSIHVGAKSDMNSSHRMTRFDC